ncbi:MAG: sigma 54-interacting transcriptional regulator [Acidobacteriota bacterium]
MTMMNHDETTSLCLRSEIDDESRIFPLGDGELILGSSRRTDVVLTVSGVSRRHARLTIADDALKVEDLGSRNGTFVAGARVETVTLQVGEAVRFGPVEMRLERLDAADTELGLRLDPPSLSRSRTRRETSHWRAEDATVAIDGVLALVDLLTLPEPDLAAVVERLRGLLDAATVAWVEEDTAGRLTVVAVAGSPDSIAKGAGSKALRHGADGIGRGLLVTAATRPSEALLETLTRLITRLLPEAIDELTTEPPSASVELTLPDGIVAARSPVMRVLYQELAQVARTDVAVLVLGETGVGKEHLAHALHLGSRRLNGAFVVVNCAAIPAEQLEAEMFGIGKGVATGVDARPGCFRRADGGTLFLDEIGELPLALQAKLLRALQDGQVHPVGRPPETVDVRVVAATNADLGRKLEEGSFRRDLYYRLAGYELDVPPLRQRTDDLAPLIGHFLGRFSVETGKRVRGVSVRALQLLAAYPWPGNIRELEHEARRLVFKALPGQAIDSSLLSERIRTGPRGDTQLIGLASLGDTDTIDLDQRLDTLHRGLIEQALTATAGNQTRAAERLSLSRSGLIKRMKRLGVDPKAF